VEKRIIITITTPMNLTEDEKEANVINDKVLIIFVYTYVFVYYLKKKIYFKKCV